MAPTAGTPYLFSPTEHTHLIPYLAAIHAQCITHDRTMATFLPPLSHDKLLAWWKERIAEVTAGTRLMLILLDESDAGAKPKGPELMGVVMLAMPASETGAMRGFIEKLLVHTKFRQRGGARTLMERLEQEALKRGKTVLVSDFLLLFSPGPCPAAALILQCWEKKQVTGWMAVADHVRRR